MQTVTLKFDVSGQNLIAGYLTRYASNTVNYVKAVFDLDGNWNSFDSVRAVWSTDFECISTVLDSEGVCYVPQEVLKRTGNVMVNLVGSIAENDELTDRLTTYPVVALVINANANDAEQINIYNKLVDLEHRIVALETADIPIWVSGYTTKKGEVVKYDYNNDGEYDLLRYDGGRASTALSPGKIDGWHVVDSQGNILGTWYNGEFTPAEA